MSELTIKYITPRYFYDIVRLLKTLEYRFNITDNSFTITFDTDKDLCQELFNFSQLLREFEDSSVPIDLEEFIKTYSPIYRHGRRYFKR